MGRLFFARWSRSALFFLLFTVSAVSAQQKPRFDWDLGFDVRFDNREYDGLKHTGVASSQTLFSARVAPAVGLGWVNARGDGHHRVMAGGTFTLDMGDRAPGNDIEELLFYHFDSPKYSVLAGKFERRYLIGEYSRAIYSGSSAFYDNVLDGMVLQHHPRWGYVELALDWDGAGTEDYRESFRVLSAGRWSPSRARSWWGAFSVGYSFDLYHLASRTGALDGVVDHILINPFVGFAAHELLPWFERLSVDVGAMSSLDRDRAGANEWLIPEGTTIDFTVQKWNVGLRDRLYMGDPQMPLRPLYGKRVYQGDGLFSAGRFYNYTTVYWRPRLAEAVSLNLELGLHTDGKGVGLQQVAGLCIEL